MHMETFIQKKKDFVKFMMLGCVRKGLSLESATCIIGEAAGITDSLQYLDELYIAALNEIKAEKFSNASGIYYSDEQFLKINGKEVCRLAIKDAVTRMVLLDI